MRILRLLQLHIQEAIYVRSQAFIWFLIVLINPLIYLMFWQAALREPSTGNVGQSPGTVTTYYLLLIIAEALLMAHVEIEVALHDIYEGTLSRYLLKPVPYIVMKFLQELPWRLSQAGFGILVFLVLRFFWPSLVQMQPSPLHLLFLLPVILAAHLLSFVFKMILGLTAVWTTDFRGLSQVVAVITFIFAGYVIPLSFLPEPLYRLSLWLPFASMIYFPVTVAQGTVTHQELWMGFLIQTVWVTILFLGYQVMWRLAVKKYCGVGD